MLPQTYILKHHLKVQKDILMIMGLNNYTADQLLDRGVDLGKIDNLEVACKASAFVKAGEASMDYINKEEKQGKLFSYYFLAENEAELKRKLSLKLDLPYGVKGLAEAQRDAKSKKLQIFEVHLYYWKQVAFKQNKNEKHIRELSNAAKKRLETINDVTYLTSDFC